MKYYRVLIFISLTISLSPNAFGKIDPACKVKAKKPLSFIVMAKNLSQSVEKNIGSFKKSLDNARAVETENREPYYQNRVSEINRELLRLDESGPQLQDLIGSIKGVKGKSLAQRLELYLKIDDSSIIARRRFSTTRIVDIFPDPSEPQGRSLVEKIENLVGIQEAPIVRKDHLSEDETLLVQRILEEWEGRKERTQYYRYFQDSVYRGGDVFPSPPPDTTPLRSMNSLERIRYYRYIYESTSGYDLTKFLELVKKVEKAIN